MCAVSKSGNAAFTLPAPNTSAITQYNTVRTVRVFQKIKNGGVSTAIAIIKPKNPLLSEIKSDVAATPTKKQIVYKINRFDGECEKNPSMPPPYFIYFNPSTFACSSTFLSSRITQ